MIVEVRFLRRGIDIYESPVTALLDTAKIKEFSSTEFKYDNKGYSSNGAQTENYSYTYITPNAIDDTYVWQFFEVEVNRIGIDKVEPSQVLKLRSDDLISVEEYGLGTIIIILDASVPDVNKFVTYYSSTTIADILAQKPSSSGGGSLPAAAPDTVLYSDMSNNLSFESIDTVIANRIANQGYVDIGNRRITATYQLVKQVGKTFTGPTSLGIRKEEMDSFGTINSYVKVVDGSNDDNANFNPNSSY